jgi:hypothetical protein
MSLLEITSKLLEAICIQTAKSWALLKVMHMDMILRRLLRHWMM